MLITNLPTSADLPAAKTRCGSDSPAASTPSHCKVFLRLTSCAAGACVVAVTCRRFALADWKAGVDFKRWPAGTRRAVLHNRDAMIGLVHGMQLAEILGQAGMKHNLLRNICSSLSHSWVLNAVKAQCFALTSVNLTPNSFARPLTNHNDANAPCALIGGSLGV